MEQVEAELVERFGVGAAAFFPSGTMAQQCALRVWCDRAGTTRVAIPDLSHLLVHESDGPRLLHGFRFEHLTTGRRTATAADLAAIPGRLAAVMVELPLRDAGCLLPEWDDLVALSAAARERGAAFHVDGARVWESQPFYDRSYAEIAAVADTMYVSFYKGLGGIAGAALLGPEDVVAEARLWRQRMGGTLFHVTAEAVSALAGLRDLPSFADHLAWARALGAELPGARHHAAPGTPADPDLPGLRHRRRGAGERAGHGRDGARGPPAHGPLAAGRGARPGHDRARLQRVRARPRPVATSRRSWARSSGEVDASVDSAPWTAPPRGPSCGRVRPWWGWSPRSSAPPVTSPPTACCPDRVGWSCSGHRWSCSPRGRCATRPPRCG